MQRNPFQYKTRFGLYKATIRAMDELSTTKRAWWICQALFHCDKEFPDFSEQLRELVYRPATLEDLTRSNELKN
jgi:hypothetical protein